MRLPPNVADRNGQNADDDEDYEDLDLLDKGLDTLQNVSKIIWYLSNLSAETSKAVTEKLRMQSVRLDEVKDFVKGMVFFIIGTVILRIKPADTNLTLYRKVGWFV